MSDQKNKAPAVPPACEYCGRAAKTTRLPTGWKRHQGRVACDRCWGERYLLRAVTMPVAAPLDQSWEETRSALKAMWVETTRAANWMATELYARDVRRETGMQKMPPMIPVYLYPELRREFPALPAQTVSALEHTAQRKYRARRYDVIWTRDAALPTCRYPVPFPVHNQSWHATFDEGDRPVVSVRLGEKRVRLRLKSGAQFRRQLEAFRAMAGGGALAGELAIYPAGAAILVKMVAWLARPARAIGRAGVLAVATRADKLLVAVNSKDELLWNYNGDHLGRWVREHRRQLDRWSEDSKFENRPVPSFAARRTASVDRFHRRMASAVHEISAQLAGYAARRHFETVSYDDQEHGFCEQFPWFRLRALLAEKLDREGIQLLLKVAGDPAKEPLAGELHHGK